MRIYFQTFITFFFGIMATTSTPSLAETDDLRIEKIVVTAQKSVENIQDVPISVSALSSDELADLKLHDTTEIVAQIPNVQVITPYSDSL